jgi:hypothetical protein
MLAAFLAATKRVARTLVLILVSLRHSGYHSEKLVVHSRERYVFMLKCVPPAACKFLMRRAESLGLCKLAPIVLIA